jgi:hypothetical protein
MKSRLSVLFVVGMLWAPGAHAAVIDWTDWQTATTGPDTVVGAIGGITVTYTGDYNFVQTGGLVTNYWTEPAPGPAPYTGNAVVDNAPTAGEMIALTSAATHTISFSSAVLNPILAIVSLGQPSVPVTYDFDTPFSVLSEGRGFWGDGSYTLGAGDSLTGYELHAVLQFSGLASAISWTSSPNENWHGVTVGLAPVPLPAALPIFGVGLALMGFVGRRRKRTALAA